MTEGTVVTSHQALKPNHPQGEGRTTWSSGSPKRKKNLSTLGTIFGQHNPIVKATRIVDDLFELVNAALNCNHLRKLFVGHKGTGE